MSTINDKLRALHLCSQGGCSETYPCDNLEQLHAAAYIAYEDLRAEVDQLTTRAIAAEHAGGEFFEDAKRYRADNDRLRAALRKYGHHTHGMPAVMLGEGCSSWYGKGPCTCGLDAALAQLGET